MLETPSFPGFTCDQYWFLNRSGSPQTVRIIEGHGFFMTRNPPSLEGLPSLSTISTTIPGSGRVADPGFVGVAPGNGEIKILPVSVCHHVSTIGHCSLPIFLWYQIQASGLIGSPT